MAQTTQAIAFGHVPTIARVGKLVVATVGERGPASVEAKMAEARLAAHKRAVRDPFGNTPRSAESKRDVVQAAAGKLAGDKLAARLQAMADDVETGSAVRNGDAVFLREAARILSEASTTLGKASETPAAARFVTSKRGTSQRAR